MTTKEEMVGATEQAGGDPPSVRVFESYDEFKAHVVAIYGDSAEPTIYTSAYLYRDGGIALVRDERDLSRITREVAREAF